MIKTEMIEINGQTFKRTYSDDGKYIRKVGTDEVYSEAIDIFDSTYIYHETDEIIENK